jgi:hypothetical protein
MLRIPADGQIKQHKNNSLMLVCTYLSGILGQALYFRFLTWPALDRGGARCQKSTSGRTRLAVPVTAIEINLRAWEQDSRGDGLVPGARGNRARHQ